MPFEPCPPHSVRHVDDARPGNDLRPAVASHQLQSHEPGAGRRHGARGARAPGVRAPRRAGVAISWRGTASSRSADPSRSGDYGGLVGGRRFNLPLDQAAARKHPREWTCSARRCRASTCATWSRADSSSSTTCVPRHAARSRRPATRALAPRVAQRRRELRPRASGHREGRGQEATSSASWPRSRGRPCKAPSAEGELDARHPVVPTQPTSTGDPKAAGTRHAARRFRRRRRHAGGGNHGSEVDLSPSVSDARLDRQLVRGGGCARRQGHVVVGHAVGVPDPRTRRR